VKLENLMVALKDGKSVAQMDEQKVSMKVLMRAFLTVDLMVVKSDWMKVDNLVVWSVVAMAWF
jgi:DNA polymerase/3'-5' exonuclease PolX